MPKELLMLLGKKKKPTTPRTTIRLYKVFFVETVLDMNTFMLLFVSGMFTQIQNLYCWAIHQDQGDLVNSPSSAA